MTSAPELVADAHCRIAEGPVWHPDEQCIYWTDIPAGKIYRFEPGNGSHELVYRGEPVGGMTVQQDGSLLLFGARGRVSAWRDGHAAGIILSLIPDERNTRFNDVIADPQGRVIGGTMAELDADGAIVRHGRLYGLETNRELRPLLDGMGSPNGMGFTADLRHMYMTDSFPGVQAIFRFDYDVPTGTLSNREVFHQTPLDGSLGRPDGMAVDIEGCVWSARWDGAAVARLTPDRVECERHVLPVSKVTSVTFGGPEYTDLYITTASDDNPREGQVGAGGLFRLQTGTRGKPEFRSRVRLT